MYRKIIIKTNGEIHIEETTQTPIIEIKEGT